MPATPVTPAASTLAFGHAGLNVSDLARSLDFYRDVFGLDVIGRSDDGPHRYAFLGRDGTLLVTLWEQSSGRHATDRPGLHHFAFRVESIGEVEAVEVRLRARGAAIRHDGIVPHAEGGDSGGIFFEDPDGIRLEVSAPSGAAARGTAPHGAAPTCGFF